MKKFSMKTIGRVVLSLPKTIYFNFRHLPVSQAVHLPILVAWNVRMKCAGGGGILIDAPSIKPGMIHIGINQGSFDAGRKSASMLQLQSGSKIIFHGKAGIAEGVIINNGGIVEFGENFSSNFGLFITCSKRISFGDNCLLGWNNHFIDNDGHKVIDGAGNESQAREISIGNHTWITSETHFMKGSKVGNECVVGYNAFVLKDYSYCDNILIAGNPAKIVKEKISWKK